jgi:hypothetical protein
VVEVIDARSGCGLNINNLVILSISGGNSLRIAVFAKEAPSQCR